VTLGDDEARRRGVQKSVLERKGPPVFSCAVEMVSRTEWRVHRSLASTVDALLAGQLFSPVPVCRLEWKTAFFPPFLQAEALGMKFAELVEMGKWRS
jgi:hypothetical protein